MTYCSPITLREIMLSTSPYSPLTRFKSMLLLVSFTYCSPPPHALRDHDVLPLFIFFEIMLSTQLCSPFKRFQPMLRPVSFIICSPVGLFETTTYSSPITFLEIILST